MGHHVFPGNGGYARADAPAQRHRPPGRARFCTHDCRRLCLTCGVSVSRALQHPGTLSTALFRCNPADGASHVRLGSNAVANNPGDHAFPPCDNGHCDAEGSGVNKCMVL